jgi:hypothetical protein
MTQRQRISRRQFVTAGAALAGLWGLGNVSAGRTPPTASFSVIVPDFMVDRITQNHIDYLNETIPSLHASYRETLLPMLDKLPQVIVVNTLTETLIHHGNTLLAEDLLGDEALTLFEAQHLLITTRFGSVATPHRGDDPTQFGKLIYLKQHRDTGYRTPDYLLLEELIHIQQDITIMQYIIEQDDLDPKGCLHGPLKGISELAAHYYTDDMAGEADYVFMLDDGTHCETAADAVRLLSDRLNANDEDLVRALLYDVETYAQLDGVANANYDTHIWEMVTTWRHARDENGDAVEIAPAFIAYDTET